MPRTDVLLALVLSAALTAGAAGQTVIDDTAARTPHAAEVIRVVASQLRNADTAQIRGLKMTDKTHYCGWVNAKTVRGGYAGFRPFVVGLGPPAFVAFNGPGNEGQFEAGAVIFPMPGAGKGCGVGQ